MFRMFRSMLFFAALGSLAIVPALADLINVTVNGTVSASGSVSAVCNPNDSTPGCVPGEDGAPPLVTTPFSFSASDTQLGSFSQSWNATTIIGGLVQPFADEITSVCMATPSTSCPPSSGDALYVELTGGHTNAAVAWNSQKTETMALSFQLTQETEATLYSSDLGSAANGGEILDSTGSNVLFQVPVDGSGSILLPAGSYELYASVTGGASGGEVPTGTTTDSLLYLTAQFAPVPEPRGAATAALLCVIAGGCLCRAGAGTRRSY